MALPLESVLTFASGLVLLALWALAANENNVSLKELSKLSILYFLAPIIIVIVLTRSNSWILLILSLAVPLLEECLKRLAANRVKPDRTSVFFLVSLFGIWELIISKPLMPLFSGWPVLSAGWEMAAFIWLASLPILMHTATAAIYAFYPTADGNLRYWPCVAVHWAFNASRGLYGQVPFGDVSPMFLLIDTAVWMVLLLYLLHRADPRPRIRPS